MGGEGGKAVSSGVGIVEVVDLIGGSQGCALQRAHEFVIRWKKTSFSIDVLSCC